MAETKQNIVRSNKWVFAIIVVSLYTLVVLTTLFTHQPPEITTKIVEGGASGVGILLFIVLIWA